MFDIITLTNWLIMILSCAVVVTILLNIKTKPKNKRLLIVIAGLALAMGLLTWFVDIKRTQYEQKIFKQMIESNNEMLKYRNLVKELNEQKQ